MIGLGNTGRTHLRNLQRLPGVEVIAIADTNPSAGGDGKAVYTDYREVIDIPQVDAVVISLPHSLHGDSARLALKAGKNVFLEKPTATTYREAQELAECAAATGGRLLINMTHRFYPPMRKARELLRAGAVGKVISVRDFYMEVINRHDFPTWFFDPVAAGGGVAITDAIHLIDRVGWLLEEPLITIASLGRHLNAKVGVEECVEFLCTTASEVPVSIGSFFCFEGPRVFEDGLRIYGTRGVMAVHAWSHVEWTVYGEATQRFEGYSSELLPHERSAVGHEAAIVEFIAAVRDARPSELDVHAVLNAQRVVQDFYDAHPVYCHESVRL